MHHKIQCSAASAADWQAAGVLVAACRAFDGSHLPIQQPATGDADDTRVFLYLEADQPAGVATLSAGANPEVLAAVHPQHRRRGIGTRLLAAVAVECQARGAAGYLLVTEGAAPSGAAFARYLGATHAFSEHLMRLDRSAASAHLAAPLVGAQSAARSAGSRGTVTTTRAATPASDRAVSSDVVIRPADADDLGALVELLGSDGSQQTISAWLDGPGIQLLVCVHQGRTVGMLRVSRYAHTIWLNSFAVHASLRGQGFGRHLLLEVLRGLPGDALVLLEVETDNHAAVGLYTSVGFRVTATFDYYRRALA